jgi:hypothetical protein
MQLVSAREWAAANMNVHIESFDPETVALMRVALDHAWSSLPRKRQTPGNRSTLAAAIVSLAAQGERDAVCLSRDAFDMIHNRGEWRT